MVTIILAVAILAYAGWAIYEIRMKKKNCLLYTSDAADEL